MGRGRPAPVCPSSAQRATDASDGSLWVLPHRGKRRMRSSVWSPHWRTLSFGRQDGQRLASCSMIARWDATLQGCQVDNFVGDDRAAGARRYGPRWCDQYVRRGRSSPASRPTRTGDPAATRRTWPPRVGRVGSGKLLVCCPCCGAAVRGRCLDASGVWPGAGFGGADSGGAGDRLRCAGRGSAQWRRGVLQAVWQDVVCVRRVTLAHSPGVRELVEPRGDSAPMRTRLEKLFLSLA